MITKFPKTPSTNNNYRKPQTTGTKARAAQVPKGSASAKSSFILNSQQSTSSLAHSSTKVRGHGFISSQGNHTVDNSASSALKGTKSQQNPNRFASPKVSTVASHSWGLNKTVTAPHETRANNMSTKEFINHLYSPTTNSKAPSKTNLTTGRHVEQ